MAITEGTQIANGCVHKWTGRRATERMVPLGLTPPDVEPTSVLFGGNWSSECAGGSKLDRIDRFFPRTRWIHVGFHWDPVGIPPVSGGRRGERAAGGQGGSGGAEFLRGLRADFGRLGRAPRPLRPPAAPQRGGREPENPRTRARKPKPAETGERRVLPVRVQARRVSSDMLRVW